MYLIYRDLRLWKGFYLIMEISEQYFIKKYMLIYLHTFCFNVNALLGNLYSNIKYKMGSQVGDNLLHCLYDTSPAIACFLP